jgi:hypothetical protein
MSVPTVTETEGIDRVLSREELLVGPADVSSGGGEVIDGNRTSFSVFSLSHSILYVK